MTPTAPDPVPIWRSPQSKICYLDLMQAFVVEGLTDRDFLYSQENLPPDIASDREASDLFLSKQYLVVGKSGPKKSRQRDGITLPKTKDSEVKSLNIVPPVELEDQFAFHFMGPTIHISHEDSKHGTELDKAEHVEYVPTSKNVSLPENQDEMLHVHKRPPPSRGSSNNSQPAHKKQETGPLDRPSTTPNEPFVGPQSRPIPSRGSSTMSQPVQSSLNPDQDRKQPSPASGSSVEGQRPRPDIRSLSDPAQSQQHQQRSRSKSPATKDSIPQIPTGSPETPQTASPELGTVRSNTSPVPSRPISRNPSHTRPISPGAASMSSYTDQMNVISEGDGDSITRYDSPDSVSTSTGVRSRPSFASRALSRVSTETSPSLFSQPSSILSTSSGESGKSRFGKMFTRNRPLIDAAKAGDAERAREILRMHGDSTMNDHDGKDNWTALHWAASNGATEVCKVLLARGMSTSARTKSQRREPLFLAIKGGHLETARTLCEANCDVNAKSKMDGATALHRAALDGRDDLVILLVTHGAEVNEPDVEGMRPIMWAVQAQKNTVVQTLVSCGADLEAKSAAGLTPLHRAVSARNVVMARLLLSLGSDVNATAPFGNPLNRADATGNGDMITLLNNYGGVREVRTDKRGAPLQFTGSYAHGHLD